MTRKAQSPERVPTGRIVGTGAHRPFGPLKGRPTRSVGVLLLLLAIGSLLLAPGALAQPVGAGTPTLRCRRVGCPQPA